MALPQRSDPWHGLSVETLRFLEIHQARAVAIPGRSWRDLGDAVMLYSAMERDPFFNRLVAVRWPEVSAEFDARLRETNELFTSLGRWPHVWAVPGLSQPPDLVARLTANGFVNQGGGYDMLLVRDSREEPLPPLPPGAVVSHWNCTPREQVQPRAETIARVIEAAFSLPEARRANLQREIGLTLERPVFHAYVITVGDEPVATGQRYAFEGASYLSSIGTRPPWRGLGLGTYLTRLMVSESLEAGFDLVYLGVYSDNPRAVGLYERLGFAILGGESADLLLRPAG
jgi:ribosomal protein S18 acetylase RimI-like enzyme